MRQRSIDAVGKHFRKNVVEVVVRGYRNDLVSSESLEPSVSSNKFDSLVAFSRRGTSAKQSFVQFVIGSIVDRSQKNLRFAGDCRW